ncbi:hypothetical protein LJC59_08420, partial [Desulfovibrio sp. OttesenSCG-928-A18]|nr:hypothetical protein [Desulfovibrio sp. OttesenSCG-928-A18]
MSEPDRPAPADGKEADALVIGGRSLDSRLFLGTGKFGGEECIPAVAAASGAQVITLALR